VPGPVVVRNAGQTPVSWRLASVRCNGSDRRVDGPPEVVRLTVNRQEHLVCTFEAVPGNAAGTRGRQAQPSRPRPGRDDPSHAADRRDSQGLGDDPLGALPAPATASALITVLLIVLALSIGGGLFVVLPRQLFRRPGGGGRARPHSARLEGHDLAATVSDVLTVRTDQPVVGVLLDDVSGPTRHA
jgi:hypothetical protein